MQPKTINTDLLQQLQSQVAQLEQQLAALQEIKVEIMMADQLNRHNLPEEVAQKRRSYKPSGLAGSADIPENFSFKITADDVLETLLQSYSLQK